MSAYNYMTSDGWIVSLVNKWVMEVSNTLPTLTTEVVNIFERQTQKPVSGPNSITSDLASVSTWAPLGCGGSFRSVHVVDCFRQLVLNLQGVQPLDRSTQLFGSLTLASYL